jgi:hypothetical protein
VHTSPSVCRSTHLCAKLSYANRASRPIGYACLSVSHTIRCAHSLHHSLTGRRTHRCCCLWHRTNAVRYHAVRYHAVRYQCRAIPCRAIPMPCDSAGYCRCHASSLMALTASSMCGLWCLCRVRCKRRPRLPPSCSTRTGCSTPAPKCARAGSPSSRTGNSYYYVRYRVSAIA